MRLTLLLIAAFIPIFSGNLSAQLLPDNLNLPDTTNFYDLQRAYNLYFQTVDTTKKGSGWKAFKRWEWFWQQRVAPSGKFPSPKLIFDESTRFYPNFSSTNKKSQGKSRMMSGSWSVLGPNVAAGGYDGIGRINCMAEHPSTSSTLWIGSAGGGLWKTTNSGSSWQNMTDQMPTLGIGDVAFDPSNASVMYVATGDGDGWSTNYSVGVLKSTDGGSTWNTTGLGYAISSGVRMSRLLVHPTTTNIVLVAASNGVHRTTNGGTSWTQVRTGSFKDLEWKPGDPNIVYASNSGQFHRSTDAGATWTQITSGLPTSSVGRIAIAVSPANANYVYALIANSSTSGFLGLWRSTDGGLNFTQMSTTPNILASSTDGSGTGGQASYDLALAVSPTNADLVFVGGINIWKSANGGTSWTKTSHWYSGTGVPAVHADQHFLYFSPLLGSSKLYACNDGSIAYTNDTGANWSWFGNGLIISQFYRLGVAQTNSGRVLLGAQDNSTIMLNAGTWNSPISTGDGMESLIDYSDANIMYASSYYGSMSKSTNGGTSWSSFVSSSSVGSESGDWITPLIIHPTTPQTLYVGFKNVWKTTNRGTSWASISSFSSGTMTLLAIAPSDANTIFAYNGTLSKTTNGGTSWASITLPSSQTLTGVAVHPSNPQIVWITFSGFTSGQKVYKTTNGGTSWTSIAGTLPNLPVSCIVYQNNSPDALYIGMDNGVWYRDNTMSDWEFFSDGLPNVIVSDLEIQYSSGKIRAATYGRGLWESALHPTPTLVVSAPNGGEVWASGSVQMILWSAPTTISTVKIEYSLNNGSTWATVTNAVSATTGTYLWTLPNVSSTQALVRISNATNATMFDVSDAVFQMQALGVPALSSPANGAIGVLTIPTLTWQSATAATSYVLETSLSSTFATVSTSVSVSALTTNLSNLSPTTTYYWRVKAVVGSTSGAWSSVWSFTTGQSALVNLSTYTFSVTSASYTSFSDGTACSFSDTDDATVGISLPFPFTFGTVSFSTANICTNGWLGLGANTSDSQYQNDLASTAFTTRIAAVWDDLILQTGSEVRYKTSGSAPNRTFLVEWKNMMPYNSAGSMYFQIRLYETSNRFEIAYSTRSSVTGLSASVGVNGMTGGTNDYISITPGATSTASSATVNNAVSSTQIMAPANGTTYVFEPYIPPVASTLSLTSPNGGETFWSGQTTTISWSSTGAISTVMLQYSTNNGGAWTTITASTTNSGSYQWTIPDISTTQALVKVANSADQNTFDISNAPFVVLQSPTAISLKFFLEGAFDTGTGTMNTALQTGGNIPLNDPFGLGISVPSVPNSVVDWVQVDFRPATNSSLTVLSTCAFLRNDGIMLSTSGTSPVTISTVMLPAGTYFVVIRTRNHLPVMSAQALSLSGNSALYNFSTAQTQAYSAGQLPQIEVKTGVFGFIAGDVNQDLLINATDRVLVRSASGSGGYIVYDLSFDGIVNALDRIFVVNNRFKVSQVP